eukprot:14002601-Alexandrium_andersonii.AAC.1
MSASLVGSEMCIRDSVHPALRLVSRQRQSRGTESLIRLGFHRIGYSAVSYTHLTLPTICSV